MPSEEKGKREMERRDRRAAIGTAAALLESGVTVMAGSGPARAETSGEQARESFRVVDRRGRQRFVASSGKPPIIIGGKTYPADQRQGPEGTYLIFNDGDGNEKGGITASSVGAGLSLDYTNAQAITLAARWEGVHGAALLEMKHMPDPALPIDQVPPMPPRVQLGYSTPEGAFLVLSDSQGRPRIVLEIDGDDKPVIKVLDSEGKVVGQLPETPAGRGS
ncbi:hypothetical protein [Nonomuraea angiospora]|uniref:hypothetical protein n=1 Tax=Nonomuraea angiospora TaxID=46172 RepID=UPI0029B2A9AA|nr:hypothetical protein [Nonomuraea angiospora]MDX3108078.1 hypothetical protein [Nonomuraea angiospora]